MTVTLFLLPSVQKRRGKQQIIKVLVATKKQKSVGPTTKNSLLMQVLKTVPTLLCLQSTRLR